MEEDEMCSYTRCEKEGTNESRESADSSQV